MISPVGDLQSNPINKYDWLTDEVYYGKPTLFQEYVCPTAHQISQHISLGWKLMYS